jgi:hypothetical protein
MTTVHEKLGKTGINNGCFFCKSRVQLFAVSGTLIFKSINEGLRE